MNESATSPSSASDDAVQETTLPPLLVLSFALLASWSTWALLVRPNIPRSSPPMETFIGIAARIVFWLIPAGIYLQRYWGRRWYQPLGLNFPLGAPQIARAVVLVIVVSVLLVLGTAIQKSLPVPALVMRLFDQAKPELSAPVFEELVFRGLLLGELLNWVRDSSSTGLQLRLRFWGSLVLSSVVFVLVHYPWWLSHFGLSITLERTPPVLVTGLVVGFVFAHTRSLWACVLLHWLNNQLSLLG